MYYKILWKKRTIYETVTIICILNSDENHKTVPIFCIISCFFPEILDPPPTPIRIMSQNVNIFCRTVYLQN